MADDDKVTFREVPESDVHYIPLEMMNIMGPAVMADLELEGIKVRWFSEVDSRDQAERKAGRVVPGVREADAKDLGGFVRFGETAEFWLRLGMPPKQSVLIIAHELRHIWQNLNHPIWDREQCEADAAEYAAQWEARLG